MYHYRRWYMGLDLLCIMIAVYIGYCVYIVFKQ
nr:MAG TPA: hypothetical protein [Caudoviricetes sp.]